MNNPGYASTMFKWILSQRTWNRSQVWTGTRST
jgi:hypothetical protein